LPATEDFGPVLALFRWGKKEKDMTNVDRV